MTEGGFGTSRPESWAALPKASPADKNLLNVLRPKDSVLFRDWLLNAGWALIATGERGDLLEFDGTTVAFARDLWNDPIAAEGTAQRVAKAMRRPFPDVLKRLVAPLTDRIDFRLLGDTLPNGRVPLGAADDALRSGRKLLSASGTSAVAPTWSIGHRYQRKAQDLARDAELAHTEEGSFIFPLYVTLDRTEAPPLTFEEGSAVQEPFERRVTRTLATAVATAVELSSEPIDKIPDASLDSASTVGVSRELCLSLDSLLKNKSVERVNVGFDWSPAFGRTDALPKSVMIEQQNRLQLQRLARRLSRPERIHPEVYAGPILEIGNEHDDTFHVVIDTYFETRKSKLRVSLTEQEHDRAISWYRDRATVVVHGNAERANGRLLMEDPRNIEAWGDMRF